MSDRSIRKPESTEAAVALIEKARAMLEAARSFEDVKKVRDFAASAAVFIRARDAGQAAAVDAGAIVVRAERRLGEWLAATVDHKGGRPGKKNGDTTSPFPTLDGLGVQRKQSERWQKLAAVPAKAFARYLEETHEQQVIPTASGARRLLPPADAGNGADEQPFSLLIASGDLRDGILATIAKITADWPEEAKKKEIPGLLRDLASAFERGLVC